MLPWVCVGLRRTRRQAGRLALGGSELGFTEHPPTQVPGLAGEAEPHKRNDTSRGPCVELRSGRCGPGQRTRRVAARASAGQKAPLRPGSAPISEELKAPGACVRVSTAFLCVLRRRSAQAGHQGLPGAGCRGRSLLIAVPILLLVCVWGLKTPGKHLSLECASYRVTGAPCSCAPRDTGWDGGRFSSLPGSGWTSCPLGTVPSRPCPRPACPCHRQWPPWEQLPICACQSRTLPGRHGWRPHDPASSELSGNTLCPQSEYKIHRRIPGSFLNYHLKY